MDVNTKIKVEQSIGEWQAQIGLLQSATTLALSAFGRALDLAVMQKGQEEQSAKASPEVEGEGE